MSERVSGMSGIEGTLSHPLVQRLARSLQLRPGSVAGVEAAVRRAAVALVLRAEADRDVQVLMIRRAEYEGDPWSGHIALPGGRQEPQDPDLVTTAVRETWEETGVDIRAEGAVLGAMDELAPRSQVLPPLVVRPYAAVVRHDVRLVTSTEVAEAFWVPLPDLARQGAWTDTTIHVRGTEIIVPGYRYGEHLVWGMTERILRELVARVSPGLA